jgi:hypothetical protein
MLVLVTSSGFQGRVGGHIVVMKEQCGAWSDFLLTSTFSVILLVLVHPERLSSQLTLNWP